MPALVSPDFVHKHVDKKDVRQGYTKKTNLLLKDFLVFGAFAGIEALSVDEVEVIDVFEPDTFGAPSSVELSVLDEKVGAKCLIEEGTFAGCLGSKDGDVDCGTGEGFNVAAECMQAYLISPCSLIKLIIGIIRCNWIRLWISWSYNLSVSSINGRQR